ncbi:MAG: hypothetical protein ABSD39_19395 [Terriglobales bacterium]
MDALFVAFVISSTAILSVGLGIFGAYCAVNAVLAAINPARPLPFPRALAHQSQASGD